MQTFFADSAGNAESAPSRIQTAPLLAWYRQNARILPWRGIDDPYRIWISEIMLQQTRVAAVLGYYSRFLETFPSVEALADAPEDLLMKQWEGLGYYSRARNLQKCARVVLEQYSGQFPADEKLLLSLPGIGEYTAGAIASAAFGLPVPAVDGNVLRVVTRLTDCHDDIGIPGTKKHVQALVAAAMPEKPEDIRIFNQALMELGATVCAPGVPPACERCPLQNGCLALANGTATALPVKAPKKARRTEEKTVFLLVKGNTIALRQRPESGLLAGLWEFPLVEGTLEESEAATPVTAWGLSPVEWQRRLTARHIFSHVEWHMTGYVLQVSGSGPAEFLWADQTSLDTHPIPSAFAVYAQEARRLLSLS